MSTALLVQTVMAGLMAAGVLLAFAARFSAGRWWLLAAGVALAADQAAKWAAPLALRHGLSQDLVGGRVFITYHFNPVQGFGGAFCGILPVTAVMVVLSLVLYRGLGERGYRMAVPSSVACGLMAGGFGAIAVDRAVRGGVVDLIWFGPDGAYIYNLADLAVFLALVLLTLRLLQLVPGAWDRRRAIWRELTRGAQEA